MPAFTPDKQLAFVELVRQGFRRGDAAARVGVTASTVRRAIRAGLGEDGKAMDDTFAERVSDAEEQVVGAVESQLYQAASRGEPWAVTMFLKAKAKDEYADKPTVAVQVNNNTLNVDGTSEDRRRAIQALMGELDARLELDVIDVEELGQLDAGPQ